MKYQKKKQQSELKRPISKTKMFKIDWIGQFNLTAKGLKYFLKSKFKDELLHKIEISEIKKEEENG